MKKLDHLLSSLELKIKYKNEHPAFSKEMWQDEIDEGKTGLDYWDFVHDEIKTSYILQENIQRQKNFNLNFSSN
jgi:hypothetical protein